MQRLPWFIFASMSVSVISDSQGGLGSSPVALDFGSDVSTESWPEEDMLAKLSKGLVAAVYCGFIAVSLRLVLVGLPKRMPRHPSVEEDGCPQSWVVFMGVVYAFIYFTTDQYVPSLPQMEADLLGSESIMSGTVQMNLCVKAIFGMATAGLSDRIGRKPVLLVCLTLLSVASFCCGCAQRIEWFIASRLLQGMGESLEPVIFAMARDFFAKPSERFVVVAALQMMAFVGIALAPLVGGLGAHYLSWRAPFFGLALIWGLLASYAGFAMVECCPDGESQSYLSDLKRILDPHLLCLLLTESCVMGAYFTFNANSSYLAEVTFGESVISSSEIMLVFGALCGVGAFLIERLRLGSVLQDARLAMSLLGAAGAISLLLGVFFSSSFLWGYLAGSFLQAGVLMMALVSANVLFFEPLEDCAGMAASCEIVAQSVIPCALSAFATQLMIYDGPAGLICCQAAACVAAAAVFWLGYGISPPAWTRRAPSRKDFDQVLRRMSTSGDLLLQIEAEEGLHQRLLSREARSQGLMADPALKCRVGNLADGTSSKALRDHMCQAGKITGFECLSGNGTGSVSFSTVEEAANAITMLNGSVLNGQAIMVDPWGKSQG
ncbi:ydhC [Symbiodinium sp. CCMP2592]|nr:ydhC [Symbiodinium sp. CCMP2592]